LNSPSAHFDAVSSDSQDRVIEYRSVVGSGWPFRSLGCETWCLIRTPEAETLVDVSGFLETPLPPWRNFPVLLWGPAFPRVLPLRPIWPGFILNTLLYVGALWLILFGPSTIRRFVRRRHGQCPNCGYHVRGSAVCSECGASLGQHVAHKEQGATASPDCG
jgi:hypothetical protein